MNIDPLAEDYFNNSPYNYVANTPMIAYDPDGKRIAIVGDSDYKVQVLKQLFDLALKSETGAKQVNAAIKSKNTLVIFDPNSKSSNEHLSVRDAGKNDEAFGYDLSRANENLDKANGRNGEELESNASTNLGHEISHFNSDQKGRLLINGHSSHIGADEVNAVETENQIRKELGLPERTHYGGVNVYGKGLKKSKYDGYYELTRKKNYAKVAKDNTNRDNFIKGGSGFNVISRTRGSYYRAGRYLSGFIKRPIPQKELSIESK